MKHAKTRNPMKHICRFRFHFDNKDHTIALANGQHWDGRLHFYTDEGFHAEQVRITRNGSRLCIEWDTFGRDCDGRLDTFDIGYCSMTDKAAGRLGYPRWTWLDRSQRDYIAESMGY